MAEITICDRCKDRSKDAASSTKLTLDGFTVVCDARHREDGADDMRRWKYSDLCLDCVRDIVNKGEAAE